MQFFLLVFKHTLSSVGVVIQSQHTVFVLNNIANRLCNPSDTPRQPHGSSTFGACQHVWTRLLQHKPAMYVQAAFDTHFIQPQWVSCQPTGCQANTWCPTSSSWCVCTLYLQSYLQSYAATTAYVMCCIFLPHRKRQGKRICTRGWIPMGGRGAILSPQHPYARL